MNKKSILNNSKFQIVASVLFCELVGNIPTPLTVNSINNWYSTLQKPFFNPPNWLFGPVWTILFFLMGISFALIWQKKGDLRWFWVQITLNVLWSILFFGARSPGIALIEVIFFLGAIIMTARSFWKKSHLAAYLLFPYIAWVSFATLLNFAIWVLN